MPTMETHPRVPAPKKVPVRVVDSDVHPVPRPGVLAQYVPEPIRSRYLLSHPRGELGRGVVGDFIPAGVVRLGDGVHF